MSIVFTERFRRAYAKLPPDIRKKVKKALRLLNASPRHPSLRVHQVQGTNGIYEARVDRKYRMTFTFAGEERIMRNVDNHDECLKNP